MIKEIWEQISSGEEVRQNLSRLRKELKADRHAAERLHQLGGVGDQLTALLKDEDAKTRKNSALLMGDLGDQAFLSSIYEAYQAENQMFVKSSYLAAMKHFDYREYLDELNTRLATLSKEVRPADSQKHIIEEMRELSSLIVRIEGVQMHRFAGFEEAYDIILLTNRNFAELTKRELQELEPSARAEVFGAGVIAKVTDLNWLRGVRTYQELLFAVEGMKTCRMDAMLAAEMIAGSKLLDFLNKAHKGTAPYYFRVEFKSKMELDKKSTFTKKLSSQIEKLTNRSLINTTSNYEFEIRLVESKEGDLNLLVKLYTIRDERFSYRKEVIPTSIRPFNAALVTALSKEYLKKDGTVLDPFCGVGTMLIERHKSVPANTSYGIDLQADAIEKARINTEIAHQIIHYVNRNFFDFKHDYLFDEIITNMPFKIGRKTEEEVHTLYDRFFAAAKLLLADDGTMILYSHNREYGKRVAKIHGFQRVQEYEISKKEGTYVLIFKKNFKA